MISERLREEFTTLLHDYVPDLRISGVNATGHVPWRDDEHPSLSADLEKAVWYDLARKEGGGVKEFKARLGLNGAEKQQRAITAVYPYYDEQKNLLYEVVRYDPKGFAQRRPDLTGKWIYNLTGARRVLYKLPALLMAETVYVVEGEKDADRLWSLGLPATTNPQGAGKWQAEYSESLRSKKVVILADNDQPGEQHAQAVARSLLGKASAVKVVRLPGLSLKGDVSDWLDAGHTKEELAELVKATPILEPQRAKPTKHQQAVLTNISDVVSQPIRWLWRDRIPLGKVTVLDGDPGLGKSLASLDIAARLTRHSRMPDGTKSDLDSPAGVVLLSVEDDLADTIRPRLELANADLPRVVHLTAVRSKEDERLPELGDLEEIKTAIHAVDAKLVIIDPLMAYLPGKVDSYRDQDIRRVLAPLAALAAETGVAVLVIRHLNKTEKKNYLYRGGGSIAIICAARSGLLVARDPDDPDGERCVLAPTKTNLSRLAEAITYKVEALNNILCIVWGDASPHTAATLLVQQQNGEEQPALEEAKNFLSTVLAEGAKSATEVQKEAKQAGISLITLRRARIALNITPTKSGQPGEKDQKWLWSLPASEDDHAPSEGDHTRAHEHLRGNIEENSRNDADLSEDAHFSAHEHLRCEDAHLRSEQEGEL